MSVEKQPWFKAIIVAYAVWLTMGITTPILLVGYCGYLIHQYFHARTTLLKLLKGDRSLAVTALTSDQGKIVNFSLINLDELSSAFRAAAPGHHDGDGSCVIGLDSGDSVQLLGLVRP